MSGRTGRRSRTGCGTCRTRKIKCDEARPICGRCISAQMTCEWVRPAPRRRPSRMAAAAAAAEAAADAATTGGALAVQRQPNQCRALLPRDALRLSTSQQLRNSLFLSPSDREYLDYFPNSVLVAWVGKPWKWGFMHHLYRTVATDSPVVMRLLLALSASELESKRAQAQAQAQAQAHSLPAPGRPPAAVSAGLAHYGSALRDFRTELGQACQQWPLARGKADEIITTFFFLMAYENNFGRGWAGLGTHLVGVHAFLRTCGLLGSGSGSGSGADRGDTADVVRAPSVELAAPSKYLLLLILYMALAGKWAGTGPGGDGSEAVTRVMDDDALCDLLDQLFVESRDTNSVIYRGTYPTEELADDMSVFQALDFFHECSKLKHRLHSYVDASDNGRVPDRPAAFFLGELKRLGKRFRVLIMLAHRENPGMRLRELQAIYSTVSEYHALELLCHHAICRPQAAALHRPATCHGEALSSILAVAQQTMQRNTRAMPRLVWALAVAAKFADRPADRQWIRDAIATFQQDTGSSAWLAELVNDIWSSRRALQPPPRASAAARIGPC